MSFYFGCFLFEGTQCGGPLANNNWTVWTLAADWNWSASVQILRFPSVAPTADQAEEEDAAAAAAAANVASVGVGSDVDVDVQVGVGINVANCWSWLAAALAGGGLMNESCVICRLYYCCCLVVGFAIRCLPAYNTSDPYGLFELGFAIRPLATALRMMQF